MYVIGPDGKVVLATVVFEKVAAKLAEIMPECDDGQGCSENCKLK